ncbi:helix-turn-helix domain-containing protein [Herbaspirillum sp. HC18]|nr:helix-turn-helix domain-containing protein [Herbaspirillum sp. HC18]
MKTILIIALDGVMDSSLAITLDTLRTGHSFQRRTGKTGGVQVLVASHRKTVKTGGGLRADADMTFREAAAQNMRPDWVIVPGLGMTSDDAVTGRLKQKDAAAAMELLKQFPGAVRIGASCSSVFLLAEAGLLAGRHVTMTWWLAQIFRSRYPDVRLDETKMLVRDGRYLTAGSAFAQLDLVLAVVADAMGATVAHLCSRYLLIDQRPSQARYMIQSHIRQVDPTVVAAERWIDANLSGPIAITQLAAVLAVSPKTLSRRIQSATGLSPIKLVQRRRLLQAVHLIEATSMSVEAVAAKVGYQDGTALRKIIKREFGTAPASLRR